MKLGPRPGKEARIKPMLRMRRGDPGPEKAQLVQGLTNPRETGAAQENVEGLYDSFTAIGLHRQGRFTTDKPNPTMDLVISAHTHAVARRPASSRLPRRVTWTAATAFSLGLWVLIGYGVSSMASALHG